MPDFIAGLDLGQASDFTALAILKRSLVLGDDDLPVRDHKGLTEFKNAVVALKRYPLGTSYPAIVVAVSEFLRRPELQPAPRLVIDATGVGRPVVDLFLNELKGSIDVHPLTIISAGEVRRGGWGGGGVKAFWVPKTELVSAMLAALGTGRLKFAPKLGEADALKKELIGYQVKVTAAAHETFNGRSGVHDDLVLAVAMAVWLAGQRTTWYMTELEDDPDRRALTAERKAEERAEKEPLRRQQQAEEDRRQADLMDPMSDFFFPGLSPD